MNRIETLRSRWRPEWSGRSDLARLNGSFQKALSFIESLPAHRAKISGPGTLSAKGLNEAVRSLAAEKVIPDLARSKWEAQKTANSIQNQMLALAVPKPEKSDIAGAILRQEIRGFLRGNDKRLDLIQNSPEFQMAAFEGPAELSGMTEEMRANLQRGIIDKTHGAAVKAMEDTKEAIDVASAAIEMAINTVRAECGFGDGPDFQFDRWMATASAAVEQEIAAERAKGESSRPTAEILTGEFGSSDLAADINKLFAGLETYQFIDGKLTSVETQAAA